ncbi:MAG: hypothetical protein MUC65_09385 [Pontiellaceae bacterium]|nr:hypothetical protein [Pontiellaceae bacterium]
MKNTLYILILSLWVAGCTSSNMLNKEYRTNKLREIYPAEVTTKSDIHKKLQTNPDLVIERPETGWIGFNDSSLSQKLLKIEDQTQKDIKLVERYVTYDPRSSFDFYSLCSLWFYYDSEDRVVDVEWEWHTD